METPMSLLQQAAAYLKEAASKLEEDENVDESIRLVSMALMLLSTGGYGEQVDGGAA